MPTGIGEPHLIQRQRATPSMLMMISMLNPPSMLTIHSMPNQRSQHCDCVVRCQQQFFVLSRSLASPASEHVSCVIGDLTSLW